MNDKLMEAVRSVVLRHRLFVNNVGSDKAHEARENAIEEMVAAYLEERS